MTSICLQFFVRVLEALRSRLIRYGKIDPAKEAREQYISCGENSCVKSVNCEVRNPLPNKKYMFVGRQSVVNGLFVFEVNEGKIVIGDNSFIGGGMFVCIDEINIGNDVMISWGCTIVDNNSHSVKWSERANDNLDWKRGLDEGAVGKFKNWRDVKRARVVVKDKAWIGFNCIILKGVTIGEGAVVGAGSVVTKDVPDWTIAGGNPAAVLRELHTAER